MSFKDIMQSDLDDIFFNTDEFSTLSIVDGVEMKVIVSDNLRKDSTKYRKNMENNYSKEGKTFTLKKSDFDLLEKVIIGSDLVVDEEPYKVLKITKEDGIVHIEGEIYD